MKRLGPHYVPQIECGKCDRENHIDTANGEFVGRCSDCSAFLRRPTDAELDQFFDFIIWNAKHREGAE